MATLIPSITYSGGAYADGYISKDRMELLILVSTTGCVGGLMSLAGVLGWLNRSGRADLSE